MQLICFLILSILTLSIWAKTAEEWKTRTIYQIVTDRFGRTGDDTPICTDFLNYCGGTFKGIEKNLDYIQGMGVNAIWISPVWKNAPGGYHGYHLTNFYEINENFGSKQDLKDLIKACHDRDMWVMVDVVPNHVAPVSNEADGPPENFDFSQTYPFNDPKYYHFPILQCREVFANDTDNQTALEYCWLWKLPDLEHEDEFVTQTLLDWIRDFVQEYEVDGLRLDAVRHAPKWFWYDFSKAAGIYTVAEVWVDNTTYIAEYQGSVDSLLNFPLQYNLDRVFKEGVTMTNFSRYYEHIATQWKDHTVLGNFLGNHDMVRFLHNNTDIAAFKAAYAFMLCTVGIPAIYYGDEQFFDGGIDPANREPLWGKMNTNSEMYQYLKTVNTFKHRTEFYKYEQIERFSDDTFYAFSRGKVFFAFTNFLEEQTRTIISHPYEDGTLLCNIFNEKECLEVKNGAFEISLLDKQVKILFPQETVEDSGYLRSVWKELKKIWNKGIVRDFTTLTPSTEK